MRYQRQIILKGFGAAAQQKLQSAKVLVIGAGGLGCPALLYLAAAGLGHIGIVDGDTVSRSNLHRQVLYREGDIGKNKANCAAEVLKMHNAEIEIQAFPFHLTNSTALELFPEYDIILDGTDNFATRYLINDACVLLGKPLVWGAVSQYEGQVGIFNVNNPKGRGVNYRDLFPHPPAPGEVANCAEAGVLGVAAGIIGNIMAAELIKLLTGIGEPLVDQLLHYDLLRHQIYVVKAQPRPDIAGLIPISKAAFLQMDYPVYCGTALSDLEINKARFQELLLQDDVVCIDVREPGELPEITDFSTKTIPLQELLLSPPHLQAGTVVFICQSGKRSLHAAKALHAQWQGKHQIYSLQGGLNGWI